MTEIQRRLTAFGEFDVVLFGDATILNAPVADWPAVDCLLSWHSDGFPLKKAQQYASLRRPYLINDVHLQDELLDRRAVYRRLRGAGIGVPHHVVIDRDGLAPGADPPGFVETEDYIEAGGGGRDDAKIADTPWCKRCRVCRHPKDHSTTTACKAVGWSMR